MKFRQRRTSDNIEDRRRARPATVGAGIGGIGLLIMVVVFLFLGLDPTPLLESQGQLGAPAPGAEGQAELSEAEQAQAQFVSELLADTERVWGQIFAARGEVYPEPTLVLYTGSTPSACGLGQAAMGPFYCPGDRRVYLDLSFFDDLARRFGAPGDFAQAYVVAHEIGHHVQNLQGLTQQVEQARRRLSEAEGNRYSVALELMADCYAGVWANHSTRGNLVLDEADIREGLRAANAIGDDRLQMQAQGFAVPDSFTHGTSEQRVEWFLNGLRDGDVDGCNTFE